MMPKQKDLPEVVEKSEEEIASIIQAVQDSNLPDNIQLCVIKCIELSIWFPRMLQKKNASLRRLRALIFGAGYAKKGRCKKSTDKNNNKPVVTQESDVGQNSGDNTDISDNTALSKSDDEQNQEKTNEWVEQKS